MKTSKRSLQLLKKADELNIVAFMNLMVILVPFLLITAVFTEVTIQELNLPAAEAAPAGDAKLHLELVLRKQSFDVQDNKTGLIERFERSDGDTNWSEFSNLLLMIKSRFPVEDSITLLVEPGIDYKTLITVMDHVRSADTVEGFSVVSKELFPAISIGDAEPVPVPPSTP